MKGHTFKVASPVLIVAVLGIVVWVGGGTLNPPPGPVAATGRFGPRTEIDTLPYTIAQPGSYYLGQSLSYAGPGDGITIDADDVDIDLNGFELVGGPGTNSGIVLVVGHNTVTIHDGQLRDWVNDAIDLGGGERHHIYNVTVENNGSSGLIVGPSSIIRNVIANENENGIEPADDSKLTNCVANHNTYYGIFAGQGLHISDSVASQNGMTGMWLSDYCVLIGSNASNNGEHGVRLGFACRVTDCIAVGNGGGGVQGSGFYCDGEENHFQGCVANGNWDNGFTSTVGPKNAAEACTASENGASGWGRGFDFFQKVVSCVANHNAGDGISLSDGVCIASTAYENTNYGISAWASTVADCAANYNGADGIWADDSMVKNNTVAFNTDDGIEVGVGCHVWRNNCAENQDDGIEAVGDGNNIEGNNCYNNMSDAIDTSAAGGNSILSNRERGNPGGYNLNAAADTYGPIFAGPGAVNTGAAGDHFVNVSY